MTYRELYESATRKLEKNEINLGEYEEMTKPLNEDLRTWIPVSERLPKPYEHVLRTVKSFGWNSTLHIHVDIGTICPIDTDIIAWMPLLEPFESTQKSEEQE